MVGGAEGFWVAELRVRQLKIGSKSCCAIYIKLPFSQIFLQVHNKLNNTHLALMHFSWAMDLDPKGANSQIKDALDRSMNKAAQENTDTLAALDDDDEDDDEEMLHESSGIA